MSKGTARTGKIRTSSAAKKRFKITGKARYANQKPAHNHLLQQKSKKQKRKARKTSILTSTVYNKQIKRMLQA